MQLPERAYSVADAANALGVSQHLIRAMCRRGELRYFNLGKLIRIPAAELRRVQQPKDGPTNDNDDDDDE